MDGWDSMVQEGISVLRAELGAEDSDRHRLLEGLRLVHAGKVRDVGARVSFDEVGDVYLRDFAATLVARDGRDGYTGGASSSR